MKLPREYFTLLDSKDYPKSDKPPIPGAQRVGFEWYAFADPDALSRMMNDGIMVGYGDAECSNCADLRYQLECGENDLIEARNNLRDAERGLTKANEENERLEREIEKLKMGGRP